MFHIVVSVSCILYSPIMIIVYSPNYDNDGPVDAPGAFNAAGSNGSTFKKLLTCPLVSRNTESANRDTKRMCFHTNSSPILYELQIPFMWRTIPRILSINMIIMIWWSAPVNSIPLQLLRSTWFRRNPVGFTNKNIQIATFNTLSLLWQNKINKEPQPIKSFVVSRNNIGVSAS